MNNDILAGNWKQLKGLIKQQWGKLTDDDLSRIDGSLERLIGALQERYGIERQDAQTQVEQYLEQAKSEIAKV
ncbi:MAG: CsbD family protein [Anaerolineales bacterium]|jgi:uncharacterized protein YjbJ (UPF0337 family)